MSVYGPDAYCRAFVREGLQALDELDAQAEIDMEERNNMSWTTRQSRHCASAGVQQDRTLVAGDAMMDQVGIPFENCDQVHKTGSHRDLGLDTSNNYWIQKPSSDGSDVGGGGMGSGGKIVGGGLGGDGTKQTEKLGSLALKPKGRGLIGLYSSYDAEEGADEVSSDNDHDGRDADGNSCALECSDAAGVAAAGSMHVVPQTQRDEKSTSTTVKFAHVASAFRSTVLSGRTQQSSDSTIAVTAQDAIYIHREVYAAQSRNRLLGDRLRRRFIVACQVELI
jgi:hypothetical protein